MVSNSEPNIKDYEQTCQEFKWDVPEHYNFVFDVIDKWACNRGKIALISVDVDGKSAQKHTFWELEVLSAKFANMLKSLDVKKGERVFLILPRVPEWYIAVLGMTRLGVIPMPATVMCTSKDIEYRVNQSGAVMAITDNENAEKIEKIRSNCPTLKLLMVIDEKRDGWINYESEMEHSSADINIAEVGKTKSSDPMLIYFTSGTESYPKMVVHTQAYPLGHIVTAKFVQDLKPTDLHWTVADNGWAKTAWGKLFGQWIVGCAVLQWNQKDKFVPQTVLEIIERFGVTTFCAPPTVYRMLILEDLTKYNLRGLRHCLSAGEPLNSDVIEVWENATGLEIHDFYGQTETVALVGNLRCFPIKPGSMGKPTPGHYVAVVDDDGNELPTGTEGHIAVKVVPEHPPGIFKGYWKDGKSTTQSFRGEWYYTGDKAYIDEEGYFWFVGREDDVIKASGYRIGPTEVENVLMEHPDVIEAAVVGSPDSIRGQIVKAFIVLKPDCQPSSKLATELQKFVKNLTAPYKYPREIEFVSKLPKTISGKIRRSELRDIPHK